MTCRINKSTLGCILKNYKLQSLCKSCSFFRCNLKHAHLHLHSKHGSSVSAASLAILRCKMILYKLVTQLEPLAVTLQQTHGLYSV